MKFLITAGPTREYIDPIRFITNESSGKMGVSIANAACTKGHDVILVLGSIPAKLNINNKIKIYNVVTALEMLEIVESEFIKSDVLIMSAAVSDYRSEKFFPRKIKKKEDILELKLIKNPDILSKISTLKKKNQFTIGFSAETESLIKNAKKKMYEKKLDMIIANDITLKGAGFQKDTNIIKILYNNGKIEEFDLMAKTKLGKIIIDRIEKNIL